MASTCWPFLQSHSLFMASPWVCPFFHYSSRSGLQGMHWYIAAVLSTKDTGGTQVKTNSAGCSNPAMGNQCMAFLQASCTSQEQCGKPWPGHCDPPLKSWIWFLTSKMIHFCTVCMSPHQGAKWIWIVKTKEPDYQHCAQPWAVSWCDRGGPRKTWHPAGEGPATYPL